MFPNFYKMEAARRRKPRIISEGYKKPRVKLDAATKRRLIRCPRGCTEHRTEDYRYRDKKTYDPKTRHCHNCGFTASPKDAKHPVIFKKASEL